MRCVLTEVYAERGVKKRRQLEGDYNDDDMIMLIRRNIKYLNFHGYLHLHPF